MAPGARLEILEVEAEDVVALDDVGVALRDEPAALDQQRALVEHVAADDVTEAGAVRQRHRDDAIAFARGIRKLEALGRDDLDVERQAAQLAEAQAAERRASGEEQVGVRRVAGKEVRGGRGRRRDTAAVAAQIARTQRVGPR